MRLLHTSDWHLGITLLDKSRRSEMEAFFSFLIDTINSRNVDTLIISGDIYDTAVPSNEAQNMYYDFLNSLGKTCCRDVVVIAGNHDSPSLLGASASILKRLHIHVYSSIVDLEPLVLEGRGIILPVPFPRDGEIRRASMGETIEEGEDKLKAAISSLYCNMLQKAKNLELDLPIIATGHLSVSSASFDGEKNKELYLGGLGVVDSDIFSKDLSYTALGHIHKPQSLNNSGTIRYSGSPIALTFEEAKYSKSIVIADCRGNEDTEIETVEIPRVQDLITLRGESAGIKEELKALRRAGRKGWIKIILTSPEGASTIRKEADEILKDSSLEVLSSKNETEGMRLREESEITRPLSSMSEEYVLSELLDEKMYSGERKEEMMALLREVLREVERGGENEN